MPLSPVPQTSTCGVLTHEARDNEQRPHSQFQNHANRHFLTVPLHEHTHALTFECGDAFLSRHQPGSSLQRPQMCKQRASINTQPA